MAELTEKEVRHIADLARIKLSEKETEKFQKDLASILDYINKLNGVDTEDIEPLFQTTGIANATREDKSRGEFKPDAELDEKLIGQAPQKEGRFVKVKSILTRGNK